MEKLTTKEEDKILFEIIGEEKKNLRSQEKSDREMVEHIMKIICSYSSQRM